jgi:hypothetical protein
MKTTVGATVLNDLLLTRLNLKHPPSSRFHLSYNNTCLKKHQPADVHLFSNKKLSILHMVEDYFIISFSSLKNAA